MWKDPIVEEVRAIRDENARRFGYDLDAIFKDALDRDAPSHPSCHPEGSVCATPASLERGDGIAESGTRR
jgi:hypothetical protein